MTGVVVPYDAWAPEALPEHLRVTLRVVDEQRGGARGGKDVEALQHDLAPTVQETISHASRAVERGGLTAFPRGRRADAWWRRRTASTWCRAGRRSSTPGTSVDLRVLVTRDEQRVAMRGGVRRLLRLRTTPPLRYVVGRALDDREKLALGRTPHGSVPLLVDDALGACLDAGSSTPRRRTPPPARGSASTTACRSRVAAFDRCLEVAGTDLGDDLLAAVKQAAPRSSTSPPRCGPAWTTWARRSWRRCAPT